uniref:Uncharacterized protein n=1 Tax=Cacopsylla melanoneura TaxID=428564 RepID=A0A8D8T8M4_9HEMI
MIMLRKKHFIALMNLLSISQAPYLLVLRAGWFHYLAGRSFLLSITSFFQVSIKSKFPPSPSVLVHQVQVYLQVPSHTYLQVASPYKLQVIATSFKSSLKGVRS